MALDLRRVALTAIETAFGDDGPSATPAPTAQPRSNGKSSGALRGVVAGAALVTAARMAVKHAPALPGLDRLAELAESARDQVEDRLVDMGWLEDEPGGGGFDDEEEPDDVEED